MHLRSLDDFLVWCILISFVLFMFYVVYDGYVKSRHCEIPDTAPPEGPTWEEMQEMRRVEKLERLEIESLRDIAYAAYLLRKTQGWKEPIIYGIFDLIDKHAPAKSGLHDVVRFGIKGEDE